MENRWFNGQLGMQPDNQQHDNEADEASILEDLTEDFRLPISHRPTENVDLENVEQAPLDKQLTSSNVGFRLLQKMGWKGKGLGKNEQGIIVHRMIWKALISLCTYLIPSFILASSSQ
ncbi:PREDICTED: uncharacterized protein LOC109180702 isoform X1 [Ipomoea nil]|uniref:uncharacterized protein LOC109155091 isoform X1 n=1 Tax=Ipomoea nil TaxID=35883 RepID=UPI0009015B03|nr:PREDICTED: uncharacterized protein LOC109155091 isoform X1 [Ipomoea nil]XP_019185955.1 PREDICTED: uncharacterized protein LOC109180702 isoform X1 [Ipomoea nil]